MFDDCCNGKNAHAAVMSDRCLLVYFSNVLRVVFFDLPKAACFIEAIFNQEKYFHERFPPKKKQLCMYARVVSAC